MNPPLVPDPAANLPRLAPKVEKSEGKRIVAIVSAANRHGVREMVDWLTRHFPHQSSLDIRVASSSQHATRIAAEESFRADIVVAVGGDGTVADVASGIFGTDVTLGIVPAGSTNITARALGIPSDPLAAMDVLAGPSTQRVIDVGRSGERSFLNMAGAGFDAELFKAANPFWKRRLGWLAYLPAAALALRLQPSIVRVAIDGDCFETQSALILVANGGAAVAPSFTVYPGISVNDGWLDVLVFSASTPAEIVATLGQASLQKLDRSPHVVWRRAQTVRIDADPPLAVELDGDARGTTPRQFTVVPGGLRVVTPLPVIE